MNRPDCFPLFVPDEDGRLNQDRYLAVRRHTAWIWGAIIVIVGLVDFWGSRYDLNPDGVSYVEMAAHASARARDGLINGYWSPGYPALLMPIARAAARPEPLWDSLIPSLHVVNLLAFVAAAASFVALLRLLCPGGLPRYRVPFGVAVLAVLAIQCIGIGLLTPDMDVLLAILVAACCCAMVERSPHSWRWTCALGASLAAGFWIKGILFPVNALLLVLLFLLPPRTDRARSKVALASGIFTLLSLPLIVMVSLRVGQPTAGEVGRLNYAWETNGVTPFVGWLGDSTESSGRPLHPPRTIVTAPQTLEFATPFHATYPLWFDPAYWYAGLRLRFDGTGQVRAIAQGLRDLGDTIVSLWVVAAALLAMWLGTSRPPDAAAVSSRLPGALGLWAAGGIAAYTAVHVESRYLAGFLALAVAVAWCRLARRTPRRHFAWFAGAAIAALFVSLAVRMTQSIGGFDPAYRPAYLVDARQLRSAGLKPDDRVAMVGDAFEAYAAFAAGTPVTVQVMDSAGFWNLAAAGRDSVQRAIAASGVRALLANNVAPAMAGEGWRIFSRPDSSNLGLLLLKPANR